MAEATEDYDLERQFNPRVTVPDFQRFLDRTAEASCAARFSLPGFLDVRYGAGPRQRLDIFPAADPKAPLVAFVHGGSWRALSKEAFSALAGALRPRGVSTIVVGYDLCPAVTLDVIVEEIAEAIAWCGSDLRRYGIDAGRIVLAGSSAGAHLVAMALFAGRRASRADAACLASGIYDLAPVRRISVGAAIGLDEEMALRNSPMFRVRAVGIPLLIAVGALESPAWRGQSIEFARRCEQGGVEARLMTVPDAHHFSMGMAVAGSPLNEALAGLALSPG